jgi:hypothetical protein
MQFATLEEDHADNLVVAARLSNLDARVSVEGKVKGRATEGALILPVSELQLIPCMPDAAPSSRKHDAVASSTQQS